MMGGASQQQSRDCSIRLYAEFLPNIRQVTLYASLPPSRDTSNNYSIALSPDCRTVDSSDGAGWVKLHLPARVSVTSTERLRYNDEQRKGGELSFRLLVDENNGSDQEEGESEGRPWGATHLSAKTRLRCRQCHNILFPCYSTETHGPGVDEQSREKEMSGEVVFKDLPSQNWAEMMDFWHCHKPDEHEHDHDHDHSHARNGHNSGGTQDQNEMVKGYGASNRVTATPGTVLVDVSSFIIAEADGLGLKKVRFLLHVSYLCLVSSGFHICQQLFSIGCKWMKYNILYFIRSVLSCSRKIAVLGTEEGGLITFVDSLPKATTHSHDLASDTSALK